LILIVDARSDGAKIAVTWPNLLLDLVVLLSFFRDIQKLFQVPSSCTSPGETKNRTNIMDCTKMQL